MRFARPAISLFIVLGLSLIGLHLAPILASAIDITELQAGLMTGAGITWAAFQATALLYNAEPTPSTHQD
ncbi:hypothetical protein ACFWV1_12955 [Streptomyces sp. NPDC058700]|uniref:hypothetical protein n=1 Tax=Streptomyces sp. NPDC058700 TaxID=3346607 RepID=UPI00365B0820